MNHGLWGLAKICGDKIEFRNKIISTNICNNIISILLSFEISNTQNSVAMMDLYRNAIWFITQTLPNNTKHLQIYLN